MVKQFVLKWNFANIASPRLFFAQFFADSSFIIRLHESIGDSSVDVSEWIPINGPDEAQRIVFYSKNDGGSTTRCIETQRYTMHADESFKLLIHVNPENPLGGTAFAIDAVWNGRLLPTGSGTEIDITVNVECKKRLWWGGNSMVESFLEKSARVEYEKWIDAAQKSLRGELGSSNASPTTTSSTSSALMEDEGSAREDVDVRLNMPPEPQTATGTKASGSSSIFNRHAVRYRLSTVGHGLVSGTERFVSALYDADDREEREALIHVPMGTTSFGAPGNVAVFYHEGRYVNPNPRRRRKWILMGVITIIVLIVVYIYHHNYGTPTLL